MVNIRKIIPYLLLKALKDVARSIYTEPNNISVQIFMVKKVLLTYEFSPDIEQHTIGKIRSVSYLLGCQ